MCLFGTILRKILTRAKKARIIILRGDYIEKPKGFKRKKQSYATTNV